MKREIKDNVDVSAFYHIAEEFRNWQRQWELFDKKEIEYDPPNLDEFITSLEQTYVTGFRYKN